jgi:hypothetical protein
VLSNLRFHIIRSISNGGGTLQDGHDSVRNPERYHHDAQVRSARLSGLDFSPLSKSIYVILHHLYYRGLKRSDRGLTLCA